MVTNNGKAMPDTDKWRREALMLVRHQKTLILSTSTENQPWAAPVYFVYVAPAFYFFSNPQSKHTIDGCHNTRSAAALFSDAGDRWEQIQGLQMVGRIHRIRPKAKQIAVTAHYFRKFPFTRKLFNGLDKRVKELKSAVGLFAFFPDNIYYMNNMMGFGVRLEFDIQSLCEE